MQVLQLDDLDFCRVEKHSILSGKQNVMFLPVTEVEINTWLASGGTHVKDAFPQLSGCAQEFLMSGITPEEMKSWKKVTQAWCNKGDE